MKCTNCSHEQNDGIFCSKCGQQLSVKSSEQIPIEKQNQQIKEKSLPSKENKTQKNMNFLVSKESIKAASYLTIPSLLIVILVAWIFTLLLKSTVLIKDYTYLLFSNTLGIPDNILVELITQLKVKLWDVLVVAHLGSYEGHLMAKDIDAIQFRSSLPVIIAPILLIITFTLINRFIKSKFNLSLNQWIQSLFLGSVFYALFITILLKTLEPTYKTTQAIYELSTPFMAIFLKAMIIFILSGVIGLQLWRTKRSSSGSRLFRAVFSLRPFIITLSITIFIMGIIIVVMWALIHPAEIFTKPLTTPASLWTIYKGDPLFYLLLPTFLFGELLYSIGNSLVVSTVQIGELIQVPNALKINAVTGITVLNEQEYDLNLLKTIEKSTRFIWYAFAFLLVFLFSLNRVKYTNLQGRIVQIVIIALLSSIIAASITFQFTSERLGITGTIGFSAIMTGIITMIVTAMFFAIKQALSKKIITKVGDQTE